VSAKSSCQHPKKSPGNEHDFFERYKSIGKKAKHSRQDGGTQQGGGVTRVCLSAFAHGHLWLGPATGAPQFVLLTCNSRGLFFLFLLGSMRSGEISLGLLLLNRDQCCLVLALLQYILLVSASEWGIPPLGSGTLSRRTTPRLEWQRIPNANILELRALDLSVPGEGSSTSLDLMAFSAAFFALAACTCSSSSLPCCRFAL
jgi:hypothetical protein